MIRLAIDEDFNGIILRGLRRKDPLLDAARVHDANLAGSPDESVLEWAAREKRLLLTHDVTTMIAAAYARVGRGEQERAARLEAERRVAELEARLK